MNFSDITPELLYDLSKEVLKEYNIDLLDVNIDENEYLKLVCLELLDRYKDLDSESRQIAILSSNVVLVLENFILNLKLIEKTKDGPISKISN